ncbi:MAG: restriction endonuclease subunit S [Nitrosotalea sp.]
MPLGWISCKLSDLSIKITDGEHLRPKFVESGIPFLSAKDIGENGINLDNAKYITKEDAAKFRKKCNPEINDLLIVSRGNVGKVCVVNSDKPFCLLGSVILVKVHPKIDSKYINYYLKQLSVREKLVKLSGSTVQGAIYLRDANNLDVLLCPLNEQKRIVSKIEELFSKIDSTFESLIKTKLQLKSYKSSLLKFGFLGELTKDKRNSNSYDSVGSLLEKIKDIKTKQEKKPQKIALPEREDEYFHQIPHSWRWVRVGNICLKLQYGTSEKATNDSSGIPVLRMGNIIDGELNFDDLKYFSKNWSDKDEFLLKPGDILFNRTNSAELVGKTAVVKDYHTPSVFASYLIRAKVAPEIILPKIVSHYSNSVFGRMFIKSVVSQQVGQANVNGTKFAMMCIPLIPKNEQIELIDKIETGISLIQNLSRETDLILQNLLSLKSSILKKGFEGKLVPQDPSDEYASILLQKIKLH